VEQITSAICAELALPSLMVQSVKEVQLLLAFWLANPEMHAVLHAGPRVRNAHGQMGAVLEEVRPGTVSLNLWRIPLAVEFFSNMCLDRAALAGISYVSRCVCERERCTQ